MPPCPNCGAVPHGRWCSACGQEQRGRLTLRELLRSTRERVADTEQGLLRTLRTLLLHPGQVPRDYIEGRRRRHIHPVAFLILAASAQLLLLWVHGGIIAELAGARATPDLVARLQVAGLDDPRAWLGERYIDLLQNAYTWMAALCIVLPAALLLRLLLAGRGATLAETLVFSAYTVGWAIILSGITGLAVLPLSQVAHGLVEVAALVGIGTLATWQCWRPGWWLPLAGLLTFAACYLVFVFALGVAQGWTSAALLDGATTVAVPPAG